MDINAVYEYAKTLEGLIEEADVAGLRYATSGSSAVATGTSFHTIPSADLERITITAGTWVLLGYMSVPSNATGRRSIRLYNVTDSTSFPSSNVSQNAVSGTTTRMQALATVTVDKNTVITLQIAQNSGSELTVSLQLEAVLIASAGEVPSGGAVSYNQLSDKPQIEGFTLAGNKEYSELGLNALTNNEIEGLLSESE